jgi:hypothetical protein
MPSSFLKILYVGCKLGDFFSILWVQKLGDFFEKISIVFQIYIKNEYFQKYS